MSEAEPKRGELWWVNLDPTQGSEIRKTRPCVVLTTDTLNRLRKTVVVVPLSTAAKPYPPITISVACEGSPAVAIVDQVRAIGKHRLKSRIEQMADTDLIAITKALREILEL
jgi:mRNA interferase MazF